MWRYLNVLTIFFRNFLHIGTDFNLLLNFLPNESAKIWEFPNYQPADLEKAAVVMDMLKNEGTVYPKIYAHGFVVLCFVVVMQSFIMNSHEVFIHIHQGCFAGTGAIVRLPQCQWSKPDGYGKISQCITTTKHSKARTVCIFLGIYCILLCMGIVFATRHALKVTARSAPMYYTMT